MPAFDEDDEDVQMSLVKEAAVRHGIRAKLRGDEIYQEGLKQAPRFLLTMDHFPKVFINEFSVDETFFCFSFLLVKE